MEKNEIIDILKMDQNLINEAFRRLLDGTSDLKDEDRDYIDELFYKVKQAVTEHIIIEEEGLLSKIASEEAAIMHSEHKKMEELLDEARHSLVSERPVAFKALIAALKNEMIEHAKVETHLFRSLKSADFDHEAIKQIQDRIHTNVI